MMKDSKLDAGSDMNLDDENDFVISNGSNDGSIEGDGHEKIYLKLMYFSSRSFNSNNLLLKL